jgi:hypothetical protein
MSYRTIQQALLPCLMVVTGCLWPWNIDWLNHSFHKSESVRPRGTRLLLRWPGFDSLPDLRLVWKRCHFMLPCVWGPEVYPHPRSEWFILVWRGLIINFLSQKYWRVGHSHFIEGT